ncbi:MAG: hypothetical protein EA001_14005 [Oscillatoriales cyanobacterium]|nr:MAG: hypothetical protein EA001_14005 [Oscillatoriales cyanobacterium]
MATSPQQSAAQTPNSPDPTNLTAGDRLLAPYLQPTEPPTDRLPPVPKGDAANLRRATFQMRESVLDELDRFHLELQLALGKSNAPYKEVIVEAAIVQLLNQAKEEGSQWVERLQQWQQSRLRSRR